MGGPGRKPQPDRERVDELYATRDFIDAYSEHIDLRVERDPQWAIGGMWEEIGQLQVDFLIDLGLGPGHRMLDIGCGTLRGGRHFIAHLDPGGYSGIDISAKAIEAARRLVAEEGLERKRPRLVVSERKDLRFEEFHGERFDFVLAQSVFTHLPPDPIAECFAHLDRVMGPESLFCFTFKESPRFERVGHRGFRYPFEHFAELAARNGLAIEDRSEQYAHPRGQRMAVASPILRQWPGT